MCQSSNRAFPNYILFFGDTHLGESIEAYQKVYPSMAYVQQTPPGKWDQFISWLNPVNTVERVLIYKVDPTSECEALSSSALLDS